MIAFKSVPRDLLIKVLQYVVLKVVQGLIFMAGTLGIKTGIAKALRIEDDVRVNYAFFTSITEYLLKY